MNNPYESRCRICGNNSRRMTIKRIVNGYELFYCDLCSTILIDEKPNLQVVTGAYNSLFSEGNYAQHRTEWEMIKSGKMPPDFYRTYLMHKVERMVTGRKMIEIGGGTGAFGVLATKRGWDYVDFDISQTAVNFARKLNLTAYEFGSDGLPPLDKQSADVIVMWEVIEHVWDVQGYLNAIKKALCPGGILLLSTPNWLRTGYQVSNTWGPLTSPPIHINFFTKESLEKTLTSIGFDTYNIIERRIYRPGPAITWMDSIKTALFIREPESLYGIIHRD